MRLRHGDSAAFAEVFRAYYAALVRFAGRYVSSTDAAEDVAQEVLTTLWEQRATLDPNRSLRSYLFTVARNRTLNVLAHDSIVRKHAARESVLQEGMPDAPAAPAADAVVLADELARVAAARIATLSPRLQEIYHLSRDEGLSPKEIAELLGIAVATVHVQLARIVRALYPAVTRWVEE